MTPTRTPFMTGDEVLEFALPDGFVFSDAVSTVRLGERARMLTYLRDPSRDPATDDFWTLQSAVNAPNGVPTEVYEADSPPIRLLVWRLPSGLVAASFNPDQHLLLEMFRTGVHVEDSHPPRLVYEAPFEPGDPRDQVQRDQLVYRQGSHLDEHVITLARLKPGARPDGTGQTAPDFTEHSAGTSVNVMVRWLGPRATKNDNVARLRALANSLRHA